MPAFTKWYQAALCGSACSCAGGQGRVTVSIVRGVHPRRRSRQARYSAAHVFRAHWRETLPIGFQHESFAGTELRAAYTDHGNSIAVPLVNLREAPHFHSTAG
jgi:hypothetical protein